MDSGSRLPILSDCPASFSLSKSSTFSFMFIQLQILTVMSVIHVVWSSGLLLFSSMGKDAMFGIIGSIERAIGTILWGL